MRRTLIKCIAVFAAAAVAVSGYTIAPPDAHAKVVKKKKKKRASYRRPVMPVSANAPTASLVFDANTGRVMSVANPDQEVYPASLTKMMTLYIAFRAIREGWLRFDDRFVISAAAAAAPPTKMGLYAGNDISVDNLLRGAVTRSANDAARVLAEGLDLRFGRHLQRALRADRAALELAREAEIADDPPSAAEAAEWAQFISETNALADGIVADGSESDFARIMTLQARMLGMNRTVFRNSSGLPDMAQVTTAPDMALLAYAIVKMPPAHYAYFSLREFDYAGVNLRNHNREFLAGFDGADGIKTGYTVSGGFNVVDSAVRDGKRLIAIVMGRRSRVARESEVTTMLTQGFQLDQAIWRDGEPGGLNGPLKAGDMLALPSLPRYAPTAATPVVLPIADDAPGAALPSMAAVGAGAP